MADQDEDQVDTDYSGRPYRLPTVEELAAADLPPPDIWDIVVELPDGRNAAMSGGRYYIVKDDGWPDWDQPVHIPGVSPEPPRDGDLIVQ